MPIYPYKCIPCDHERTVIQKMDDAVDHYCSRCGEKMTRTIAKTSFVLAGSGWYKDGYRK